MSQEFHATYESGVLRLDSPLALPELARVSGVVTSMAAQPPQPELISDEQFFRELDELALDVLPLPPDFSRADIYLDHD